MEVQTMYQKKKIKKMEVETQTLSNFDLKSKPPFYSMKMAIDSSELHSQEYVSSDMLESPATDAPKTNRLEPPVVPKTNRLEVPVAPNSAAKSPENDGLEVQNSDSFGKSVGAGESLELESPMSASSESHAAVKVQKVYRSYRTRRRLADSAVVAEELWWQAIDFARLNHSTISFFHFSKPETAASRWYRISLNASKVGKGLSKDDRAQKLAFQHWIEAIDPRHRYGHNLHLYYDEWCKADAGQPFFYWLDVGDGKEFSHKDCPRSKLCQQCIKYLGPQEREDYEYIVVEGKIIHKQTKILLNTYRGLQGAKYIFVMSTSEKLYAGEKKKGIFHHSSFLAGGATLAAGRLEAEHGVVKSISAYSGHYCPTDDSLSSFLSFLTDNGVNLDGVQIRKATEDSDSYTDSKSDGGAITVEVPTTQPEIPKEEAKDPSSEPSEVAQTETRNNYQRTLSGGLQSPRAEVPKKAILERMNSKKAASSYQLGRQVSLKWSTGAGPRIGCVADYPVELRLQALEIVNLSPRVPPTPSAFRRIAGLASPTAQIASDICTNDLTNVGMVSFSQPFEDLPLSLALRNKISATPISSSHPDTLGLLHYTHWSN